MKKLIFGNFKMNFDLTELSNYLDNFLPKLSGNKNDIVLFLPATNLIMASQKCSFSNNRIGAQNIYGEENGAFTGEVSAKMIKTAGASWCIVGHSERRKLFNETNADINKKIKQCLKYGLSVVLCVGETKNERVADRTNEVLTRQIEEALKGIYENELKNLVIAYEPVWAIGTGESATIKQVEKAIECIKNILKNDFSENAMNFVSILYGGSVNTGNASTYINVKGVNGLLIGGACLKPEDFLKLCNLD